VEGTAVSERAQHGDLNGSNMRPGAYEAGDGVEMTTQYGKGTMLTCGHEGCGCRVRIDEECHCPSGDQAYTQCHLA
jgi:metallothionein